MGSDCFIRITRHINQYVMVHMETLGILEVMEIMEISAVASVQAI